MNNNTIKSELTDQSSTESFEPEIQDSIDFREVLKQGLRSAAFTFFAMLILFLILNWLGFGLFLYYFWDLLLLASATYFFSASLTMWFGPSPQWAAIKAKYRNRSVTHRTTTETLQDGFGKMVAATILFIFSTTIL